MVHVATAGAMLLVGVRLVVGIGRRIVGVMQCNRQTKRQMEREWKVRWASGMPPHRRWHAGRAWEADGCLERGP